MTTIMPHHAHHTLFQWGHGMTGRMTSSQRQQYIVAAGVSSSSSEDDIDASSTITRRSGRELGDRVRPQLPLRKDVVSIDGAHARSYGPPPMARARSSPSSSPRVALDPHVASRKSLAGAWLDNRDPKAQRALEAKTGNTESSVEVDPATLKANLIKWIGSSGVAHGADGKPTKDVKPGNRMHYYKMFNVAGLRETNQTFTAEELDCLAEYLLTLK
jgi:hypothetical protein